MPQIPNPSRLFHPPQPPLRVYRSAFDPTFGGAHTLKSWGHFRDYAAIYQDNGTSTPVTSTGQSIGRVYDRIAAAGYWAQSTNSQKPTTAAVGGRIGASFDDNDSWQNSAAKSYWRFLHGTAGCTCMFRLRFASADSGTYMTLFDNTTGNNGRSGHSFGITDSGAAVGRPFYWVGRSSPSSADVVASFGTGADNSHGTTALTITVAWKYGVSGDDYRVYFDGTLVHSQESSANAPDSNDSFGTLTFGLRGSGTAGLIATVTEWLWYEGDDVLAKHDELRAYMATGE